MSVDKPLPAGSLSIAARSAARSRLMQKQSALSASIMRRLPRTSRWLRLTTPPPSSITGTSISTPTTVASAAPDSKPNRLIAAATASSKKLLAPISADGPATLCDSPQPAVEPVGERRS